MMNQKLSNLFTLELVWWLFTAVLVVGILYPILSQLDNYPFLLINGVFIIIFVTFTRYIFLLRYTFLAHEKVYKAILIALSIPIVFYLVNQMNIFQAYIGEEGMETFMPLLSFEEREPLMTYIRNEMLLFGMGSIIAAAVLPFRMVMSIWRNHNIGTV